LDRHFNSEGESSGNTVQSAQRRRRQKKRLPIGSKPYMSDAWIGSGPVPTSLSTEALLETIQVRSTHLFKRVIPSLLQLTSDIFSSHSLSPAQPREPPLRIGRRSLSRRPRPPRWSQYQCKKHAVSTSFLMGSYLPHHPVARITKNPSSTRTTATQVTRLPLPP
jgi:hypothetical protein